MDKEFNLLHEPWILVRRADASVHMLSLPDVLLHAHEYEDLSGELPTMDAAILRLLLAVLHSVFYRVDENGVPSPLKNANDADDRWENLWKMKRFPEKPIRGYLQQYEDRFWLFHPERPFYQAFTAKEYKKDKPVSAKKLNGTINESADKIRFFSSRSGNAKESLSFSEAARWLIHINAYDDSSIKPSEHAVKKELPSSVIGWLGKLGLLTAKGANLFETLMLNFVLYKKDRTLWDSVTPVWELKHVPQEERTEIVVRNDQAELLTVQSRRLYLVHRENRVIEFYCMHGDFLYEKNMFVEQMTRWREVKKERYPRSFSEGIALWREFPTFIGTNDSNCSPGLIEWNAGLPLPDDYIIHYQATSLIYGDKNSSFANIYSDKITFHKNLLGKLGNTWVLNIQDEIENIKKAADALRKYAKELGLAEGDSQEHRNNSQRIAQEQLYFRIDSPFRLWLQELNANQNDMEIRESIAQWGKTAKALSLDLGKELAEEASPAALAGRTECVKEKKYYYSTAKSLEEYIQNINGIWKEERINA